MPGVGAKRPRMSNKEQIVRPNYFWFKHNIKRWLKSGQEGWAAYKLRFKRRHFLFRAWRKSYQLQPLQNRTSAIKECDILLFLTVRNEIQRLPFFLNHHRTLGIRHFIVVDNDSSDGTLEYLKTQSDIFIWRIKYSYKLSRFGVD